MQKKANEEATVGSEGRGEEVQLWEGCLDFIGCKGGDSALRVAGGMGVGDKGRRSERGVQGGRASGLL